MLLPYVKPPLSANQRLHHMARHQTNAQVLSDVGWLVKAARIPHLERCRVQLHYRPTTNRRRDTDNLYPLLKVVCDGLHRAGVTDDDTPEFMEKPEPILLPWDEPRPGPGRPARVLWVEVLELPRLERGS